MILRWTFQEGSQAGREPEVFFRCLVTQPSACYAQKTIAFHLEFSPEIVEKVRYDRLTLYSLENLVYADKALGRKK